MFSEFHIIPTTIHVEGKFSGHDIRSHFSAVDGAASHRLGIDLGDDPDGLLSLISTDAAQRQLRIQALRPPGSNDNRNPYRRKSIGSNRFLTQMEHCDLHRAFENAQTAQKPEKCRKF